MEHKMLLDLLKEQKNIKQQIHSSNKLLGNLKEIQWQFLFLHLFAFKFYQQMFVYMVVI